MGITMDRGQALGVATAAFDAGIAVMYLALWACCRGQRSRSVLT